MYARKNSSWRKKKTPRGSVCNLRGAFGPSGWEAIFFWNDVCLAGMQITATGWVDRYHSWHQGLLQPCQNMPFLVSHIHQSLNLILPLWLFLLGLLYILLFSQFCSYRCSSHLCSQPISLQLYMLSLGSLIYISVFNQLPPLGKAPIYVSSAASDSAPFWKNKTTWNLDHSTQISH